ncbi:carboxypeptidase-like regulatory domain-containing protein [Kordia sp. YSTF-M3]|uniref:Carboxypeptidase-like regulatory domain-containing protein n=1 Tax=Kordia aestuariivivens TaxID=2759037 RepID=A0ABR7QDP6_9FLAO|nr:VIT domain-containing protein [Kordia aestuariivivens]MBC8756687.1 carboxypeptidase-like regulatory domain-containing protein [Kordia aestuariivivens]
MKQYLYLFFFLLCTSLFAQNIPSVTVKDAKDLKLTDLKVSVAIIGNLAVTTYDMKFYNGLNRTLEGELVFPLGEGQTVSGFAMDVNGKLRDAVIVEKELARVAFESTVRQRIDPGLLEKTAGNNYKARVYPILPKNYKHIVIKFEQELKTFNSKQTYELPLGISEKLDTFSVDIRVFNEQQPIVSKSPYKDFFFQKKDDAYLATVSKKAYKPKKPIVIQIPNSLDQETVSTYNGYFHYYKVLAPTSRLKSKPKKITILWDASYSMRHRNVANELKVLQGYLEYLQDVKVTFIAFNNAVKTEQLFTIKNGNIDLLRQRINSVQYDGGTKLNLFHDLKIKADEVLLFSDGLGNLGEFSMAAKMPVYSINSLVSANHQQLINTATQSGGSYINLTRFDTVEATRLLKEETYQFLGVNHTDAVREIYPKQRMNVYQDFAITGQFTQETTLELLFGYGGNVTEKIPVTIKTSRGTREVKRLWAKQKLNYLNSDKEKNKQQIISLAKQYDLITDYTSMLILDRIEDYVRYRIEPPQELMAEYKRRLETAQNDRALQKQAVLDKKQYLLKDYENVLSWYGKDYKPKKPVKKIATIRRPGTNTGSVSGTITDSEGMPLPGATVIIKGTTTGRTTDFDGNYSIDANNGQTLVVSYVGFKSKEIRVSSDMANVQLEQGEALEAVTVVAYDGAVNNARVASAVSTITSEDVEQAPLNQVLQGTAAGVSVSTGSGQPGQSDTITIRGRASLNGNIEPLYVIDGVPVDQESFRKLTEEDIQEVSVLKNTAATAIYGNRGAGGIIVITTKNGVTENKEAIAAFNEEVSEKITMKPWNSDMPYIEVLQKEVSVPMAYQKYLEIRETYNNAPTFYLDVADFFHDKKATDIAITVLTNLMEVELHNHELLKAMAYKSEYFQRYDMAVIAYKKVLELRPEEPQSYRDLALAYELAGKFQESYDLLYKLYDGQLLEKDSIGRYRGIEQIAFVELTRLVSKYNTTLEITEEERSLFKPIPVDVRIVIDWNHNDTDIDLWVFDPKGEKASYANKKTKIGGRMSKDLTRGYGPEEFMLKNAINGEYKVMVNHYSDNVQKISGPAILKVTLYTNYGTEQEKKEVAIVRLEEKGGELEVGSLFFEK